MPINLCEQTISFIACICSGFALGLLYDILSGIRKGFSLGKISVFILDSLFWQISALLFFAVLYITCNGSFRWYVMLGLLLGLALYIFTLSAYIRPFAEKFVKFFYRLLKRIFRIILLPFYKILQFILWILRLLYKLVQPALKTPLNFVKNTIAKAHRFSVKLNIYTYFRNNSSVNNE